MFRINRAVTAPEPSAGANIPPEFGALASVLVPGPAFA